MSALASLDKIPLIQEFFNACSAIAERNFLELLGLHGGLKAVVRLPVTDSEGQIVSKYCTRIGWHVVQSSFRIATVRTTPLGDHFTINVPWDDPRGLISIVYISGNLETAKKAEITDQTGSNIELATLYQYPTCCASGYEEIMDGAYWVDVLVRRSRRSHQSHFSNKLAYLFDGASLIPDYFPCSLSCNASESLGKEYDTLMRSFGLTDHVDSLCERLTRPILISEGSAYQFSGVTIRDELFFYKSAKWYPWGTGCERVLPDSGELKLVENNHLITAVSESGTIGTMFLFDSNPPS